MSSERWTVIKVGGSLFDLSDLQARLLDWIDGQEGPVVLIPGGGRQANLVRRFEQSHRLSLDAAHWLAVRAMSRNARFLVKLLEPKTVLVADWPASWKREVVPVLDPCPMLLWDEGRGGCLPHSWNVTSDSIAAHVAVLNSAGRLVLLKSTFLPNGMDWPEAGRSGLVDPYFPQALKPDLQVDWVNLRALPFPASERAPSPEMS
jgi:aspartokinase-like uncharacterized kinase